MEVRQRFSLQIRVSHNVATCNASDDERSDGDLSELLNSSLRSSNGLTEFKSQTELGTFQILSDSFRFIAGPSVHSLGSGEDAQ